MCLTVIAVCGEMESGKGSVTNTLIEEGFFRVALGDPIKSLIAGGGPDHPLLKDIGKAGWPPRQAWQTLGDESREAAGRPNVWADIAITYLTYLSQFHPEPIRRFVISDIRREFERAAIQNWTVRMGGDFECWRIVRPKHSTDSTHSSEVNVGEVAWDQVIINDGTRRGLGDLVRKMVDWLTGDAPRPKQFPLEETIALTGNA